MTLFAGHHLTHFCFWYFVLHCSKLILCNLQNHHLTNVSAGYSCDDSQQNEVPGLSGSSSGIRAQNPYRDVKHIINSSNVPLKKQNGMECYFPLAHPCIEDATLEVSLDWRISQTTQQVFYNNFGGYLYITLFIFSSLHLQRQQLSLIVVNVYTGPDEKLASRQAKQNVLPDSNLLSSQSPQLLSNLLLALRVLI